MTDADQKFVGLPWKRGGRSVSGVDCAGLAWLWLRDQAGYTGPAPKPSIAVNAEEILAGFPMKALERGDVVFFRDRKNVISHVAIYLGEGKLLNILAGTASRIENGFKLLSRLSYDPVAVVPARNADQVIAALADPRVGFQTVILLVLAIALSFAASFLLKPTASAFKNVVGRYGQTNTGLVTAKNPELPLPDLLGSVVVAGNSVYQQLPDKSAAVSNSPPQAWDQVVVLNSGPSELIDNIQVNGLSYQDPSFHSGTNVKGIVLNPPQTWNALVQGSISGDTYVPSIMLFNGDYSVNPQPDFRAWYDRTFPVYPMVGTTYMVCRWFDSSKFGSVNITARVTGRLCRQFTNTGFTTATSTAEPVEGADGTIVRFKLSFEDIIDVTSLTVNGTAYSQISAATQTGNVYQLNKTQGFIEFTTAPAAGAAISIMYDYYPRVWTQNPALHLVYLLTESRRGKAYPADRIDWASFDAARQYFDAAITWVSPDGTFTGPRYATNYALDTKKPIQDHLQAILDGCHSILFLSGGRFYLRCVRDDTSVFSFNTTNIMLENGVSTFEATEVDRAPKANRVRLAFQSDATLNSETEVVADDEDNQAERAGRAGDNGIVEVQLKFPAVTAISQAERLAETILREDVDSNWQYVWKTNIQGLALQPGDVVDVTHPSLTTPAMLLRIDSLEQDENDYLKITASQYVDSAYI